MLICDTKYAYKAPNTVSPSGFSCILYLSFFFDSKIENEVSVLEMIMMPCAVLHQKLLFIKIFQGEINTLNTVFGYYTAGSKRKDRPNDRVQNHNCSLR